MRCLPVFRRCRGCLAVAARSGQGDYLGRGVGDQDRVLELRRAPSILGDNGPAVVPHVPLVGTQVEHRLDREGHAGFDDGVVPVSYTHLTLPTIYSV